MNEPRRLLADDDCSAFARSLLSAGRARSEPEGARERVWSTIAAGIAAGGVASLSATGLSGATTAAAGSKSVGLSMPLLKLLLGAFALGLVATTTALLTVRTDARRSPVGAPSASTYASPAVPSASTPFASSEPQAPPAPSIERKQLPRAPHVARRTSPAVPPAQSPASRSMGMREEAALLQDARLALAQGRLGEARAKLDTARARFPDGQLGPERDALEIRIVDESGDHIRAISLAERFVVRHPDSPLRPGIEAIARKEKKD